jgi:nucleoside diphosphate kinase
MSETLSGTLKEAGIYDSYCFVLLKPDVLLKGSLPDVLRYFESQQFKLLHYKCGIVNSVQYELMYRQQFKWDVDFWNHNFTAYKFGPSIGLSFIKNTQGSSLQKQLHNLKGSALPHLLGKKTLRYKFNASSRAFNVLHIPDTTEQAAIESAAWTTQTFFLDRIKNHEATPGFSSEICNEMLSHGYSTEYQLNGKLAFIYLKIRLLHSILNDFIIEQPVLTSISALRNFYFGEIAKYNHKIDKIKTKSYHRSIEHSLLEALTKVISAEELGPAVQLIEVLSHLSEGKLIKAPSLEFLWYLTEKFRTYCSPLERYLINTSLLYPAIQRSVSSSKAVFR